MKDEFPSINYAWATQSIKPTDYIKVLFFDVENNDSSF